MRLGRAAGMDDDDCCLCCDACCEAICGPDDDECCESCFSCLPGCERDATPDCLGTRWCVRRDCCGVICATLVRVPPGCFPWLCHRRT